MALGKSSAIRILRFTAQYLKAPKLAKHVVGVYNHYNQYLIKEELDFEENKMKASGINSKAMRKESGTHYYCDIYISSSLTLSTLIIDSSFWIKSFGFWRLSQPHLRVNTNSVGIDTRESHLLRRSLHLPPICHHESAGEFSTSSKQKSVDIQVGGWLPCFSTKIFLEDFGSSGSLDRYIR